ncbi:hypothetical protein PSN45_004753 [Yamadazyma tenuis]|uniref:Ribonuclease H1 small subunit n=1 Tax=Candida tenuis (strain ATCC 10573 / BCRC 21748 / CBS 615 / JCM 9827 / NBRC 10315 / NRRL Y-1498 / VKM Y-70) TaxID=590646 RepID=G3B6N3_CANTC|nr:ribonuclease H1 small subunit [Yamadazyma tenuis ATCC 10573]XP_006687295.1 uncharacterized protein CANTEDRAFT_114295 [Yamadazyma tenuis ATCC 10573]EGV63501.1 ribonuclease H1 small subunit [Yamadazyma tenuis ATCC 10573]EGV63502.1 hypothetical protein CANTEDRAFT_114295 [Yamadazyma tenuis ATCC 10573]WEJ97205.1 hypothetical protein PSN45_004753 [Yamadazyma tenuis]
MDSINITPDVPKYKAHVVPCKIHYTGPAKTQDYFTPSKEVDSSTNTHICYFRGCKFMGKPIDIETYSGYILNKSEVLARGDYPEAPEDFKIVNNYTAIGRFDELTVYGHDRVIKSTDKYMLMEEWEKLSGVIHE